MNYRRLTDGERALAASVFGEALDTRRLRVVTGAPTGGWAVVLIRLMVFPVAVADFAAQPPLIRAWFVHELTHAWQFQTRPLWTLMSWFRLLLTGGYIGGGGYRYVLPIDWPRLNLEQQAEVVEHRYLFSLGIRTGDMPEAATLDDYPDVFTGNP